MGIISKEAVQELLAPHHNEVLACVEEAWKRCRDNVLPLMPRAKRRYRANAMAGLIESQARERLGSAPDIHIVDEGQRFLLGVKGRFFLLFKQMDSERRTRNLLTDTAIKFRAQLPLAEFGNVPRVTVGYRLSELADRLIEVVVFFSIDDKVQWEYPLAGDARVHQLELGKAFNHVRRVAPDAPTQPAAPAASGESPPRGRRVRIKSELKPETKKSGTEEGEGGA
ncbi:hypothetical protein JQX13_38940 [Archangium violaceum]|uniref:hypothetical protein n=1 Tax=Archangium violaceum TaxID=83451 RepID=UPI00193AEE0F|nr:hypothetical protein [Archangium violaceum]QRK06059.1 hypothetical protein JQX13_38940 [Archangium violaceum]